MITHFTAILKFRTNYSNMKFFLLLSLASLALAVRFDGDQVLTLYPTLPSHIDLINEFESFNNLADFWSPDTAAKVRVGHPLDIRFKSRNLRVVKQKLELVGMQYTVKIDNVQSLVDKQKTRAVPKSLLRYEYDVYHTYDEINQWTKQIASDYPSLARRSVLTMSEENREIPQLTLGSSVNNPMMVIDCGIHAREWISPAFCQCFVNRLLSTYGSDPDVTAMMNKLTWVIFPLLNVDGYVYSWTDDRMWRKTRSNYGTVCTGVDPNRNFDAGWGGEGASPNPCSETYYGPEVGSEQMTKGLQNFIKAQSNVNAYITFHSYSQFYIIPYSYDEIDPPNVDEHLDLAQTSIEAVRNVHGKRFDYGVGWSSFYLAAGGSDDFALLNGARISYTIELRDTGRYGFLLPADQIQPSCEEMYAGVDVIAKHFM